MKQLLAGGAITLLLTTGAFLFWQGHAEGRSNLSEAAASAPGSAGSSSGARLFAMSSASTANVPEASQKTREEKRFSRADKDKDGKVTADELLTPRHKAFAKLDLDRNNMLSFDEWAAKTINKFRGADDDHSGWLTAGEYAETAPKPRKHPVRCS